MDIVFDSIIYSLQRRGGISTYWRQLSSLLGNKVVLELDYQKSDGGLFMKKGNSKPLTYILPTAINRYCPVRIDRDVRPSGPFIFHSSYYRWCKDTDAINIITVYDFIYEKFRTDIKSLAHKLQKSNAVLKSNGIICISESTRKDFIDFFPDFRGIVDVIPMGVSAEYMYDGDCLNSNRSKKLLFVGNRSGYKKFDLVAKAMKALVGYQLVLVGGGSLKKDELVSLEENAKDRYEVCQGLSDEALSRLYQGAFCLLYPSSYEGFGIPIIEAMSCGCPVVCQRNSSITEVADLAGVYMENDTVQALVDAVKTLENKDNRILAVNKGRAQAEKFTWERTARLTLEFYEKVFSARKQ